MIVVKYPKIKTRAAGAALGFFDAYWGESGQRERVRSLSLPPVFAGE